MNLDHATAASTGALGKSVKISREQVRIQGFEDQIKHIEHIHQEYGGDYSHDIAFKVG